MICVSSSITELLAWFNLDGYVFEVLPFMNKNLFEILIDRQFRPFDVFFSTISNFADRNASLFIAPNVILIGQDA